MEEACGSPSTMWGATCGAFPGTRRALRAVPGRGRGFYNRPSQWVLGEKRECDGKKYVGPLKIDLEYAAQKWVKKGIHVRTTGSERVCPPPRGSESRPEHSFVTESEFKTVMDWEPATKLSLVPLEMGIYHLSAEYK